MATGFTISPSEPPSAAIMSIRKALVFSFIDRYASLVVSVGSSMILARLLTPADIGVFSVTMVMLSFIATFRDFGAGTYLVQEKDLTSDRVRATFAVQLGLGLFLALAVSLASGPVAAFYGESRMRDIMLVVALNYAINPFGSLTQAWLAREMRFDGLAVIRFSSSAAGAAISVVLAWKAYGPMSLALGSLASTMVAVAVSAFYRPQSFPWLPGLREVRRVVSFGTQTTSVAIVNTMTSGAPELLLGKLQTLTAVGLYSRANGLVSMFSRMVTDAVFSVSLSLFAKEFREQGNIANSFLKATAYITAIGWSFCLGLVFLAQPVIRVLYGAQWDNAVDLTRFIAVGMAFAIPATMGSAALMASGAMPLVVRATVTSAVPNLALIAIGAVYGLVSLGWAVVAGGIIHSVIYVSIVRRKVGFMWSTLGSVLFKSALVALFSAVAPAIVFMLFGAYPEDSFLPLAIGVPGSALGFLLAAVVFRHPIRDELARLGGRLAGWMH